MEQFKCGDVITLATGEQHVIHKIEPSGNIIGGVFLQYRRHNSSITRSAHYSLDGYAWVVNELGDARMVRDANRDIINMLAFKISSPQNVNEAMKYFNQKVKELSA